MQLRMQLRNIMKSSSLFILLSLPLFICASEKIDLNIHSISQSVDKQYTLQQLLQLPQHEIRTKLPWSSEFHVYKGPYLEDVFVDANIEGQWLTMHGLDKYKISFSYQKIKKYKPILALQADGKLLSIRTKGPISLVLPLSEYKELDEVVYHDYMVWNLIKINIEGEE